MREIEKSIFNIFYTLSPRFRIGNARDAAQKCSSRKIPIQIKGAFTATHFLLVSPFLVYRIVPPVLSRPSSIVPSLAPQIPSPILYPDFLSKEITAVVQCISSRCYTFANNTTQIEIKTWLNAKERERKTFASSANICTLPDTEVFLRSWQIVR